MEEDKY